MTHDEIKEQLFSLYDGPLTEKERVSFEGHLSTCAECKRSIQEWESVSTTLFPEPAFSEASEDIFVAKVMARVSTAASKASESYSYRDLALRWLVPLLGSATAAAWVFFFVLPGIPGLSTDANGPAFFSSNASNITTSSWSVVPVTSSNEEIVVSFLK